MSLSRLALRLAAVEALCPSSVAETGPWPTWAGSSVYDSRITPFADADAWQTFIEQVQGSPLVTVYTEEQETDPTTGEYPADREMVDLVIEIMIAVGASVEVEGLDGQPLQVGSLEAPITSPQHEAMLDMLEHQIRSLLDPMSPAASLPYTKVARELHHVKSAPVRDATDRLSRQAARTLTFKLRVAHAAPYANAAAAIAGGAAADIANLPEPMLSVAKALDPQSAAGQLVRQIARGQPPAPVLTPMNDMRVYTGLNRGAAAPTAANADIVSDVQLPR